MDTLKAQFISKKKIYETKIKYTIPQIIKKNILIKTI